MEDNILVKLARRFGRSLLIAAAVVGSTTSTLALCAGEPEAYRKSIVTYYETTQPTAPFDSRCNYVSFPGTGVLCRIRMRGVLYRPPLSAYIAPPGQPLPKFPAIVMNHGSGALFKAENMFCQIANYFVPRGYIVFVPFRRGQGDEENPADRSTGVYVEDLIQDWLLDDPSYPHNTTCVNDPKCYRVQLFKEQADVDVVAALNYMKGRTDVKNDPTRSHTDPEKYSIGLIGNSYGGAITVFANRRVNGQRAAIAVSPGAQQFAAERCWPNDPACPTPMQAALLEAARNARQPAYYLQAKWDYDTRPTIDLAYEHAYGSPDPVHSIGWAARIFPYKNPCFNEDGNPQICDFQSVHEGFIRDPDIWGRSVLNFLRQSGVK